MGTTVPTIKNVIIANEDTYRKEKMISHYESRGMMSQEIADYIRKEKR